MTLLGTSSQQLHITNIQLPLIMTKKIWPPLAPHRPSSTVNVTFDQCFALFSWDAPSFVQHASSLGGLHYHSFVVHWCVVAISRLMSTSFDDFHLVQNTLWNRRIPDRVTGLFVRTHPHGGREMSLALIEFIHKSLAEIEKCQQPEKC